jgi:predicted heme/steroid binding protein
VPGTHVDFRARATGGATDFSGAYVWPQATPTDRCDHPWPRASSFADVRFSHELREYDGEGGEAYTFVDGLAHAYWTGTAWDGTCQQRVTRQDFSGAWSNVTENFQWDRAPPKGELPATVGGVADVQQIVAGCSLATVTDVPVTGRETRDFTLRTSSGDPIPIDAYHGQESTTGSFAEYWWAASNGLMLDWHTHSSSSFHIQSDRGWLLNTDASFS